MTTVRVGVEWINNWHGDACHQNNLSTRAAHAEGFYNHMANYGHVKVFDWGDDNAWETDFRNPTFGGDSLNWTDDVHFCFYSDHGGNWSNIMHIAFSRAHANCLASSDQWRLGAKMLKWLVLDCCQAVLDTSVAHVIGVWGGPMRGVHLILGFLRDGHDSNSSLGEDFGDDAGGAWRLANAWLDRAYSYWLDDNPIAIAAGESQSDAINRRENETINWRDSTVHSTNWLAWKWRD